MKAANVRVPRRLLLDPDLSPTSKVVWMALQLVTTGSATRCCYTHVAKLARVSRPTVYKAVRQLAVAGWYPFYSLEQIEQQPWIRIPTHLVTDATIPANAKVLYGMIIAHRRDLQAEPKGKQVYFTYSSLAELIGWHRRTIAKAIEVLVASGWLALERRGRRSQARCESRDPRLAPSEAEVERMKRRLASASFRGEAIMREYLSLLIDSEEFEDDASPGFLVNPLTDQRLQLDRYYPPGVAFEFNGPQHYGPTERFTLEESHQQQARDLIKIGICATRGITLKIVHASDLTLPKMREIVGHLLPLRDLTYEGPRISYLEQVAQSYRRSARRAEALRQGRVASQDIGGDKTTRLKARDESKLAMQYHT